MNLPIIIGVGVVFVVFIVLFIHMSSPKTMNKRLEHTMKMSKELLENNKETIKEMSKFGIETQKEIIEANEDELKELEAKKADIESVGIEKKARAFKAGLKDVKECINCGAKIDVDSIFCSKCGHKQ